MEREMKKGIAFALLAATLYALNTPLSKILLNYMPPTLMAGFLYIGAGMGMAIISLVRKSRKNIKLEKFKDIPNLHYFVSVLFMLIGAWLSSKD